MTSPEPKTGRSVVSLQIKTDQSSPESFVITRISATKKSITSLASFPPRASTSFNIDGNCSTHGAHHDAQKLTIKTGGFATQVLRLGVEPAKVMKICGWKELRTVWLAGMDVQGATEAIKLLPSQANGAVLRLA